MRTLDIEHLSEQELSERECLAYADGNEELANLYAECARLRAVVEKLEGIIDDLPSEKQRDQDASDLIELRQFFYDCFEHLSGHYPCPEFTSNYDKSVIFEAIRRGDGTPD